MRRPPEAGPADVVERLVLGGAVAVAVVAIVFLGLSRLAASLFSGGDLAVGLGDAAEALTRLPANLRDPAAAWPPPARDVLPGPVAYHAVLASPLVVSAGALVAGRRVIRRRRDRTRPLIATSVKTDLVARTMEARRSRGTVWVFDPTECAGLAAHLWSPLAECASSAGAQRMSKWLVRAAEPKRGRCRSPTSGCSRRRRRWLRYFTPGRCRAG